MVGVNGDSMSRGLPPPCAGSSRAPVLSVPDVPVQAPSTIVSVASDSDEGGAECVGQAVTPVASSSAASKAGDARQFRCRPCNLVSLSFRCRVPRFFQKVST